MDGFLARYPEFSKVPQTQITTAIQDAQLEVSKKVWGNLYDRAIYALAAHILYFRGALSNGGDINDIGKPVTSESVGSVSVGYGDITSSFDADSNGLALSPYGREYLRLRKLVRRHILVVK